MGQSLISYKGDGGWRGRTTLATNDRGDRRLVRIVNGYVSSDGHEIRSFPGWRTLLDLSDENNPTFGYSRYVLDAVRPVIEMPSPTQFYVQQYRGGDSNQQSLWARAKKVHLHAFEQLRDTLVVIGESRFREVPLYDSSHNPVTVTHALVLAAGADFRFSLRFSAAPGDYSTTDANGASLNAVALGDVFYIEGVVVTGNAAFQTLIDSNINGRVHVLIDRGGTDLRFQTDIGSAAVSATAVTAGECHRVRTNRSGDYPTPSGVNPYDTDLQQHIDDFNALTSWRIIGTVPLAIANCCSHTSHPAWVANRQRDFSDDVDNRFDGLFVAAGAGDEAASMVSRREQRELPFRVIPEPAGDRIILAVPGYNCLFQIPLQIPVNPDQWPLSPSVTGLGVLWFGNDVYDKPRALGLPQCRLIDATYTPAPSSPLESSLASNVSHLMAAIAFSPQFGFPPGAYRMCATYQDDATGEEGPPSEVIEFTIPSNEYAYYAQTHYFHPGYVMPECLALRINLYLSDTDGEPMGFYKSFDLKSIRTHSSSHLGMAVLNTPALVFASGKYGFVSDTEDDQVNAATWRTIAIPLPTHNTLDEAIDFERPPSASASMPRGASCARYIRGVLVTVGHLGNTGGNRDLYDAYGVALYDPNSSRLEHNRTDEITLRLFDANQLLTTGDGELGSGFGVAGRCFPDSNNGIDGISDTLLPANVNKSFQLDRVLNRRAKTLEDTTGLNVAQHERLRLVRPIFDPNFVASPADATYQEYNMGVDEGNAAHFYWKMFKGQVQVGDPGAPWRVTKAGGRGIQFIDPNGDDDGVAVFQLAGNAIICTRKETYFLSWNEDPAGSHPTTVSNSYGCIAANSMVEFDGGVAWISERGPVALGASLQFVGEDIQEDFVGDRKRYLHDSRGMMRHAWACHDASRGLVLWGLVTTDATHTMSNGVGGTVSVLAANEYLLSRAPCNEILIWSYRTNSYSTWVPPSGLEVLWMRTLRIAVDEDGLHHENRVCFLAADGRIYTLDDAWQDVNATALTRTAVAAGTASTALTVSGDDWNTDGVANGGVTGRESSADGAQLLRAGQVVEAFNDDDEIVWRTTIASANPATDVITLAAAQTWTLGQSIRIGARPPMVIETCYLGAEALTTLETDAVQVRYTMTGSGRANANVQVLKSDLETDDEPLEVSFNEPDAWLSLGITDDDDRHGRRRQVEGKATAPEMAVRLTISSEPQVRITEIALEV